jgi:integrase
MARKAHPWWRSTKRGTAGRWYVTIRGEQTPLPVTDRNDEAGAWAAFQRLLREAQSSPPARTEPVAELVSEYLDSISHRVSAKTRADYAAHLRRLVARFPNSAPAQIESCILERQAANENWSDSHRANYLWTCQAFLRWAGRKDLKLHRPPKESRGADAMIPPELHARVLRETTGDFHQLVRLLWVLGCRPMEAAGLAAESIDWATATVTLRRQLQCRSVQPAVEAPRSESNRPLLSGWTGASPRCFRRG